MADNLALASVSTAASYEKRAMQTLEELGIPFSFVTQNKHVLHGECDDLVSIGLDMFNREQRMDRRAAAQWQLMLNASTQEGVVLSAISAFRSFDYQRQIIERRRTAGETLEKILTSSALPGYSEHHTGRAIDIGTPGSPPLEEIFEQTPAFDWLRRRAGSFGFSMSFPRGNPFGIIYEPWHWLWRPA